MADQFISPDELNAEKDLLEGEGKPQENQQPVKKEKEEGYRHFFPEGSWMISYANLMTILMIFFMILYAYSTLGGTAQYEKAMATIQKEMGGDEEQLKQIEKKEKEAELASQMEGYIKDKNLAKFAKVETNAQRVKISLASPILFDSGSSHLKPAAVNALVEIGKLLKTMPNSVVVEGHTDNIPMVGGLYRSNFELSAARAFSVIKYFIEEGKMEPSKFSAFGYGEFMPLVPNDTRENRAMNRRIEINIIR